MWSPSPPYLQHRHVAPVVNDVAFRGELFIVGGPAEVGRRFGGRFAGKVHHAADVPVRVRDGFFPRWHVRFVCGGKRKQALTESNLHLANKKAVWHRVRTFDVEANRLLLEAATGGRDLERFARVLAAIVLDHLFDGHTVGQLAVPPIVGDCRCRWI